MMRSASKVGCTRRARRSSPPGSCSFTGVMLRPTDTVTSPSRCQTAWAQPATRLPALLRARMQPASWRGPVGAWARGRARSWRAIACTPQGTMRLAAIRHGPHAGHSWCHSFSRFRSTAVRVHRLHPAAWEVHAGAPGVPMVGACPGMEPVLPT